MLQDDGSAMKQDAEVLLMLRERAKGRTQEQAAARAGMSVRTVRVYERRANLPSQLKQPRTYRSRPNPFADDWPWIAKLLEDDPALQGQTLFGLVRTATLVAIRRGSCARCSGTSPPGGRSTDPIMR